MSEDAEERRQRDLRDLEFYRQRLRPTIADLWRTIENAGDNRVSIASTSRSKTPKGEKPLSENRTSWLDLIFDRVAEKIAPKPGVSSESGPLGGRAETICSLVAALIVLLLLEWSGMSPRIPLGLP